MIVSKFAAREPDTFWVIPSIEIGFSCRITFSVFAIVKFGDLNAGVSFLFGA